MSGEFLTPPDGGVMGEALDELPGVLSYQVAGDVIFANYPPNEGDTVLQFNHQEPLERVADSCGYVLNSLVTPEETGEDYVQAVLVPQELFPVDL